MVVVESKPPPDLMAKIRGGDAGQREMSGAGGFQITMNNETFSDLAKYLEQKLGEQVMDQTGTSNRFDINLKVQTNPDESTQDALKRSVLEQLGLELVPTNSPVDMLIVTKMK